jgi:hypothetical protein
MADLCLLVAQVVTTVPAVEWLIGANATLNVSALVGIAVLRSELKALRRTVEKLEGYILENSRLGQ